MSRPVMLSNGSLMVGLNEQGLVHDFYYPYVGLENLTTSRSVHHYIGVWVDGEFSWVDSKHWESSVDFESDALVSKINMRNEKIKISLDLQDFVDSEHNAFCRKIKIKNNSDKTKDIRVFLHQVFQISNAGRADTAIFIPDDNYILDYKGRCCLLVYGENQDGQIYDQFAIGNYGIEDKEGTYIDAEDGELSGSAVEHGGVDSVIRFKNNLDAGQQKTINYWIVAATSQYSAEQIHSVILKDSLDNRLEKTRLYWEKWMEVSKSRLQSIDNEYIEQAKKSLLLIKAHIDKRGGILASGDSSIYNYGRDYYSYVWPRDGSYAVWPLIRLGYKEEPKKFFEFCRDILTNEGFLMHKYQPDRAIGSTWHPLLHGRRKELAIQEDETASVIYMLSEYYEYTRDEEFIHNLYGTLVQPSCNFMSKFIDEKTKLPHASYDLWEEKFLTTTYTTALVYQALLSGAKFADMFDYPDDAALWRQTAHDIIENFHIFFNDELGAYCKGFLLNQDGDLEFDNTLDVSSFYGVMMFAHTDQNIKHISNSITAIENTLLNKSPSGGSPRYVNDNYFISEPPYLGNPWFVTTLWLGQYYIRAGKQNVAKEILRWSLDKSLPSGVMPEQIDPTTSNAKSVAPLVWSHAEYINTVLDLYK